jgi:glycine betaine/proline transport system substrate-binding protein
MGLEHTVVHELQLNDGNAFCFPRHRAVRRLWRTGVLAILLLFSLVGPLRAASVCGSDSSVKFAGINWESGEFITAVLQEIIERGYACATETVPGNTVTLEQALSNNDIQILGEEWVSRSDVWNKAAKAGTVRAVGHPFTDASEGWYIPDYMVLARKRWHRISVVSNSLMIRSM